MRSGIAGCLAAAIFAFGCEGVTAQHGDAVVHTIPEGFRGWVKVEYSVASCPAQKNKDGRKLIAVAADGTACTQYSRADGWKSAEFLRGTSHQALKEAPESACCQPATLPKGAEPGTAFVLGRTGWTCEPKTDVQVFFVGTVDEYNKDRDGWQKFACDASAPEHRR